MNGEEADIATGKIGETESRISITTCFEESIEYVLQLLVRLPVSGFNGTTENGISAQVHSIISLYVTDHHEVITIDGL